MVSLIEHFATQEEICCQPSECSLVVFRGSRRIIPAQDVLLDVMIPGFVLRPFFNCRAVVMGWQIPVLDSDVSQAFVTVDIKHGG